MFKGSMVAIVTPMQKSGQVDEAALLKLIDHQIASGTSALVVAGTTGESAAMTAEEQYTLVKLAVRHVNGRVPVIAGAYAVHTPHVIARARAVMDAGADAALIMTPAYVKPTQEGLYQHYKAIAEAVAIPQILYNVPGRTACDLLPQTIARLASVPNIVGVKEATGDLARVQAILHSCGESIELYSGDDATACDFVLAGGRGVISVVANVAPSAFAKMMTAALQGEVEAAQQLNKQLQPLCDALFVESNPIPVKWALHHLGLIQPDIRLPLTVLSETHRAKVEQLSRDGAAL